MASGIAVHPDCLTAYQELKLGKKIKYIIYGLSTDNTQIVVEKTAEDAGYEEFLKELPEDACKWAVYDFEFEKEGAGKRNKICFFMWSPDTSKIKQKMLYASSKDALRRSLVGIAQEIQGTAYDEVAYEAVLDKVSKGH